MLVDREACRWTRKDIGATHIFKQLKVDLSIGEALHPCLAHRNTDEAADSSHSAFVRRPPKILNACRRRVYRALRSAPTSPGQARRVWVRRPLLWSSC